MPAHWLIAVLFVMVNLIGKEVLGMRLNWEKRYITLAPVATVIGLAFKAFDPDNLLAKDHPLSGQSDLGITCALIPRNTVGVSIGTRHKPIGEPFQNGPIFGKDVFVPMDWLIGGDQMIGHGWRMLMECLSCWSRHFLASFRRSRNSSDAVDNQCIYTNKRAIWFADC